MLFIVIMFIWLLFVWFFMVVFFVMLFLFFFGNALIRVDDVGVLGVIWNVFLFYGGCVVDE